MFQIKALKSSLLKTLSGPPLSVTDDAVRKRSSAKILMLVENVYPGDTRVRNEAVLLASAGYQVSVISLKEPGQTWRETVHGVRVYRIPRLEWFKKTAGSELTRVGVALLKLKSFLG